MPRHRHDGRAGSADQTAARARTPATGAGKRVAEKISGPWGRAAAPGPGEHRRRREDGQAREAGGRVEHLAEQTQLRTEHHAAEQHHHRLEGERHGVNGSGTLICAAAASAPS